MLTNNNYCIFIFAALANSICMYLGLSVFSMSIVLIHGHNFLLANKNGMISRIVMTSAIYQKILSLSQVTVGQVSIGHIVNLASNDVQRLDLVSDRQSLLRSIQWCSL